MMLFAICHHDVVVLNPSAPYLIGVGGSLIASQGDGSPLIRSRGATRPTSIETLDPEILCNA
jgi:hypothetical protein